MDLKNDYKVLYEVIEGDNRVFKASKSGTFSGAETITTIAKGAYKLVYEKAGKIYGVDADGNETALDDFDAIFVENVENSTTNETQNVEQPSETPADSQTTETTEVDDPETQDPIDPETEVEE